VRVDAGVQHGAASVFHEAAEPPVTRRRRSRIAYAMLLTFLGLAPCGTHAQSALTPPETVVVRSGRLHLKALLWRPVGTGPFPAVVFNHGEAPQPMTAAQAEAVARSAVGPAFQRHGYLLLAPFRRGEGLSRGEGTAIQDAVAKRRATSPAPATAQHEA
jgi:predicted acyl esterase